MRAIVNSKYILENISNVSYTNNNIVIQFKTENATNSTKKLNEYGLLSGRLKTGTPPRIHKDSIDKTSGPLEDVTSQNFIDEIID